MFSAIFESLMFTRVHVLCLKCLYGKCVCVLVYYVCSVCFADWSKVSTNSFVGDLKFGCSPAAGYARLMEGRWESFKGARRGCTGAVVTFARTVEPIPVALRYDYTQRRAPSLDVL